MLRSITFFPKKDVILFIYRANQANVPIDTATVVDPRAHEICDSIFVDWVSLLFLLLPQNEVLTEQFVIALPRDPMRTFQIGETEIEGRMQPFQMEKITKENAYILKIVVSQSNVRCYVSE